MAKKLTAAEVAHARVKPGQKVRRLWAGEGLYLVVVATGGKSWLYRYRRDNRERNMFLGSEKVVKLAEAKEKARAAFKLLKSGVDPIEARRAGVQKARATRMATQTFKECALGYFASHKQKWRSMKSAAEWMSTLERYAFPVIGNLPVETIDRRLLLRVLEPVWNEKPDTGRRLRQRIQAVLSWAETKGLRDGDNPAASARLKGALLRPDRVGPSRHYAA